VKTLDFRSYCRLRPPVVVGIVTLLAFGLLAGSVTRLFRLRADLRRTRHAVAHQQHRLGQLQDELRKVTADSLEDQFRSFAVHLPEDAAGIRSWLTEIQCLASHVRLLISPTWSDSEVFSGPLGRLERIQISMEVRPEPGAGQAKTAAVVQWLRDLHQGAPALELNRVHFSGTNQSFVLAVVSGNLWTRVSEPAVP
jgi:hypothetical protein